jgi:hypothetical protein
MTDPMRDTWESPILPSGSSTKGHCVVNKNHSAAMVAGWRLPKGPSQPSRQLPPRACKSPHRGAKKKAIESMKQQNSCSPRVPVAKVVQSPVSSPGKSLADPTVAHAGTGVIDLAGNKSDSEDDGSPCTAPRISGSKTTGLEDTNFEELFPFSFPNTPSLPTNNEVSKRSLIVWLIISRGTRSAKRIAWR